VRESKYQDFVIKNGCFVGKFEEMYKKISDHWKLLEKNKSALNLNYQVILNYYEQIRFSKTKTLEIGCSYQQISYELYKKKFTVYGTDISKTAIEKSKKKYPELKNNLYISNLDKNFMNNDNLYNSQLPIPRKNQIITK
jgi:2-polyprenyl-3-methyl-5-hydroxy-6-metoxy-1,4-benzoquinol methylase